MGPRHVTFHAGPTNSGKTHAAIAALKAAPSGLYCAPLRLLAWETFERLNEDGTPCSLLTGQELETLDGASHLSATVEMADLATPYAVVVIDEIQMIGDRGRGWAWSRLLLGAQSPRIHVCGDAAAIPLLRRLLAATGDSLEVIDYARLAPLTVAPTPLATLADVQSGDCVVCFSRFELFKHKREIEVSTGLRCGVIYGALPPAVRREQARRFNGGGAAPFSSGGSSLGGPSSSGGAPLPSTDVLVATDAIGMGLNLRVKRVVFADTVKFDGVARRPLTVTELKQIGGRAGRFGGAHAAGGEVTSFRRSSQTLIATALASPSPPLAAAGLLPTLEQLEGFAASLVGPGWAPSEWSDDDDEEGENESSPSDVIDVDVEATLGGGGAEGGRLSRSPHDRDGSSGDVGGRALRRRADAALTLRPFSVILEQFLDACAIDDEASPFFLCDSEDMVAVAALIDPYALPFRVRYAFCMAPIDVDQPLLVTALQRYASRFASAGRVRVGLRPPAVCPSTPSELAELEQAHAVYDLYLWLARRFPAEFIDVERARDAVGVTQALISEGLAGLGDEALREAARLVSQARRRRDRKEGKRAQQQQQLQQQSQEAGDAAASEYLRSMIVPLEEEGEGEETTRGISRRERRQRELALMEPGRPFSYKGNATAAERARALEEQRLRPGAQLHGANSPRTGGNQYQQAPQRRAW